MRLCLNVGVIGHGGIGTNALHMADAFINEGHEVDLFLVSSEAGLGRDIPQNANVFVGSGRIRNSIKSFRSYLSRRKPDAVIVAREPLLVMTAACLWGMAVSQRPKFIATINTHWTEELRRGTLKDQIYTRLAARAVREADYIVGVSQGVSRDVEKWAGLRSGEVRTIYNPVWGKRQEEQLGMPPAHPWLSGQRHGTVVVAVGRLVPQKGFDVLLRAFELVRREVDASLIVFGEGPERPRLGDLVNRHGLKDAVSLPGFIANPVSEIKAANLFVLSSRWEGFGNVIVEALGAGTPVVAVDCRSGPAEILDDGRYGRLAIPEDPYDLAKKILAELDEPTPAEILRKRALDFSPAFIARQYLSLLEIDS